MTNITHKIYSAPEGMIGFIHIDGRRLNVVFDGQSREALLAKMEAWWALESERARRMVGVVNEEPQNQMPAQGSGRGQGFVGTRWMALGDLKERVTAGEVAARLEAGWIFKGPRG